MSEHLQNLYQQVILEHNKSPKNFGKLEKYSHSSEGFNPICGDHIWVYLDVDPEKKIQDIRFEGEGCAISKASASMMSQQLKGKSVDEALNLFENFKKLLHGEIQDEQEQKAKLGKLAIFSGVWKFPARVKCAALGWHTVNGALTKENRVSTEAS